MFTHDLPALKLAALSDVSRPTINQRFFKLRPGIAQLCDASSLFSSEVEGDESSFGARRVRGERGVEPGVKQSFSESWNGRERFYTEIVPDASKKPLQAVIRGQVALDSIIHSDGWRGYNGLVDMGYQKRNEFTRGNCRINGIESFWSYAKRRLAKFKGIPRHRFHLHFKECGFRFHHREENLYDKILSAAERKPSLKLSKPYRICSLMTSKV